MATLKEEFLREVAEGRTMANRLVQQELARDVLRLRRLLAKLEYEPWARNAYGWARNAYGTEPQMKDVRATYRSGPMEAAAAVDDRCNKLEARLAQMEKRWHSMEQRYAAHNIITVHEDKRRGKVFLGLGVVFALSMLVCSAVAGTPTIVGWIRAACVLVASATMLGSVLCLRRAVQYFPTPQERKRLQEGTDV